MVFPKCRSAEDEVLCRGARYPRSKIPSRCICKSEAQITLPPPPGRKYTARDFIKLSLQERDELLADAAEKAAKDDASDKNLNDFDAYDEFDVIEGY